MTVLENLEMGAFTRVDAVEVEADIERVLRIQNHQEGNPQPS